MILKREIFPPSALSNLKSAMIYSLQFTEDLLRKNKLSDAAENLIALSRDFYLFRMNRYVQKSAADALRELKIGFSDETLDYLDDLERSMRDEEDYMEFSANLQKNQALEIVRIYKKELLEKNNE